MKGFEHCGEELQSYILLLGRSYLRVLRKNMTMMRMVLSVNHLVST